MQRDIRIENLSDSNVDDMIHVCSSKRLADSVHQQGITLKRQWLLRMLEKYGPCGKIGYYGDKPVAQILYYPEEADAAKADRREGVLVINCVYNPSSETQKLGIGTRLLRSAVHDARQKQTCLGDKPCRSILAKAFNTREFLPMPEFYRKNGFLPTDDTDFMWLRLEGDCGPAKRAREYEPLSEDVNKAVIFYGPVCQFSFQFAKRIEEIILEVAPNVEIRMINEWEKPEESLKRGNWWLVVNAKPIQTFFMDTAKFKQEIRQAVG